MRSIQVGSSAIVFAAACVAGLASDAQAQLQQENVLLIYNSQNVDSLAIKNYYLAQPDRSGVLAFDLNDASLTGGTITMADYEAKIAAPVRSYLTSEGLESQVAAFTLTKGLPVRIQDINNPTVGDNPSGSLTAIRNGNATFSSVDSELTVLFGNTTTTDPGPGSGSTLVNTTRDNWILNPYFDQSNSITSYNRAAIASTDADNFIAVSGPAFEGDPETPPARQWALANDSGTAEDPGRIYLTTRLDAPTVWDVYGMIDRAQNPTYNRLTDQILFDEDGRPQDEEFDGTRYEDGAAVAAGLGFTEILLESTSSFVVGEDGTAGPNRTIVEGPIAYLNTYGVNANSDPGETYLDTFEGQFVDGAIFTSYESFNARQLAEAGTNGQEQIGDFIALGGTFAVGNVWEPLAGSVPVDPILLENYFGNNLTWAEAAWSSLPLLSWQQVVLGDPLARATIVVPEPGVMGLLGLGALLLRRKPRLR